MFARLGCVVSYLVDVLVSRHVLSRGCRVTCFAPCLRDLFVSRRVGSLEHRLFYIAPCLCSGRGLAFFASYRLNRVFCILFRARFATFRCIVSDLVDLFVSRHVCSLGCLLFQVMIARLGRFVSCPVSRS